MRSDLRTVFRPYMCVHQGCSQLFHSGQANIRIHLWLVYSVRRTEAGAWCADSQKITQSIHFTLWWISLALLRKGVYKAIRQKRYIYIYTVYIHIKNLPLSLRSHKWHCTVSLAVQFAPLPEFLITLSLLAYAVIMLCTAKGKQLNKWRCCCWCYTCVDLWIRTQFVVSFVSIRFFFFTIRFRSFVWSIDLSLSLRMSSQIRLRLLITVHLLHTSFPGSTVCLPHDFAYYCVLIVLPADVEI